MSKKFGPRTSSEPSNLGKPKDDDFLDTECDKIFHPEKFDPRSLNPQGKGDVDERQKYFRSVSLDQRPEDDVPTDPKVSHCPDDSDEPGHSQQDFAQNRSIMSKKKYKRKKSSSEGDNSDVTSKDDKHRRPSKMVSHMPGITSEDEEEETVDVGRGHRGKESAAALPWKSEITPVLDSTKANKDEHPLPGSSAQEPEKKARFDNVKFSIGGAAGGDDDADDDDGGAEEEAYRQQHIKSKKFSKSYSKDEGSEMRRNLPADPELGDIDSHRFEKSSAMSRHKVKKVSSVLKVDHEQLGEVGKNEKMMRQLGYGYQKTLDHTPHHLFVEMDELEGEEWVERARWIKYEEDLEAEAGRWGKPHVASLSFHSLINLRKCLENGVLMLDLLEVDLPGVVHRVVESLSVEGVIEEDQKAEILRVLTYRHKHVHPHHNNFKFGLRRNLSQSSLKAIFDDKEKSGRHPKPKKRGFFHHHASTPAHHSEGEAEGLIENGTRGSLRVKIGEMEKKGSFFMRDFQSDGQAMESHSDFSKEKDLDHLVDSGDGGSKFFRNSSMTSSMKRSDSNLDNFIASRNQDILNCLEEGTEGCLTLVGSFDTPRPITAFVRLAKSIVMQNTIEVNLPMRFIFILLTPENDFNMDSHEIGRSFSTLMSNPAFHDVCYQVEERRELLHAINSFLDDSVVLPPGDWDKKHILPINEIMELRNRRTERKQKLMGVETKVEVPVEKGDDSDPPKRNPFDRSRIPFEGLYLDVKNRYPKYLSDIKDAISPQCFAATIFIYFASLSGAIAFGGLMGTKTKDDIGIPETLIVSSLAGIFFALTAGCPLIIVGVTGPLLLYDESLYGFSEQNGIEFLAWRTWIGIWTFIIALIVAAFQGSSLVKYFTKFTKDIFASLICLLFIYEALFKLYKVFKSHPLMEPYEYCHTMYGVGSILANNYTDINSTDMAYLEISEEELGEKPNPNTALLSAILMFGTFFIAYFLRIFRNSKFLGRNVRRALGDFGVPISIVIMVMLDYGVADTYTEKLKVPTGLQVTNNATRGWFIPPTGNQETLPLWAMFAAIIPAILLYVILFIETEICQLIIMERTKDEKGSGLHLDVVILSLINTFCGLFGGPWICSATVRAVSHVSALTVMSTNLAPGESPRAVGVRDQRVTALCVSILVGASVLLAPILKLVPFAVLFGVFLYMGISGMNGVQFFDRLTLMFMPIKHHPQVSYVKRVKTWRMVLFTILQGVGLVVLWIVKSSPAALAFPFFVLAMIPYRLLLKFIFTPCELDALDGPQAGKDLSGEKDDIDKDFYEAAADCPIAPFSEVPLHRSIMGVMSIPVSIGVSMASTDKKSDIP